MRPEMPDRYQPRTTSPLDEFIPVSDARERYAITVHAPPHVVFETAKEFDFQSVVMIRLIFTLRARLMRATPVARKARGLFEDMQKLGWGCLVERPGALFVAGASCQPWLADVTFTPIAPARFRAFADPGLVKIAWTIECHPHGPAKTLLVSETRVVATDSAARERFLPYWRWARMGIIPIRWLLLPAIRRRAEREYRRR